MRLAGRQVPEQRSPPPPGLGSARPGSPAVSCGAAAMAPRRARGCRTLGLPALLLLLLLRPPATRDARDRLAVLAGRSRISESFNHEVQTHEACVRLRTMENCPQCHHHRTSRQQAGITCPPPMSVEHADIWVKSYSLYSRERYICNSGFKRKAGTSSLTECVLNKATNVAHWTTPSLKCIRDPALVHQRPAPPSTVTTAGVTPQPESLSPSGKEPAASSPSSNNTAATTAAIVPGSQLMPSKSPSTGTTEISSHESSHGTPSQTTAKNWELTASASHQPPGVYPQGHSDTTVAISTSTVLLCGLSAVSLLACYLKSRQTPPLASVEMEAMEALPVTWGTSSRDEDLENCSHHL
ncbi:interleukin-15 receptor subunit alpha isoform 4 [Homo sapiens]|uniref:Interleukin-15 receptor subunit alpha n=2 Tax=Homo sapiens TaxID=9606 RepID=A0A0A0MS77_HUMAN|nr:interleukin-15 receptor subunit alpha isoform 4 [Homo sapiens]|eukprot:NP_001243694.1 interleukin-15 receptor subunit alpha isoform 4 [Homo sapiens]